MTELQTKYLTAVLRNLLVEGRTAEVIDDGGIPQSLRMIEADAVVRVLENFKYAEIIIRRGNSPVGRLILTMDISMEPEKIINDYADRNGSIEQAIAKAKADVGLLAE